MCPPSFSSSSSSIPGCPPPPTLCQLQCLPSSSLLNIFNRRRGWRGISRVLLPNNPPPISPRPRKASLISPCPGREVFSPALLQKSKESMSALPVRNGANQPGSVVKRETPRRLKLTSSIPSGLSAFSLILPFLFASSFLFGEVYSLSFSSSLDFGRNLVGRGATSAS